MLSSPRAIELPPGIRAGSIVANRYRIEEVIGRGGMGVVLAARHLELDERVAVKFMSTEAVSDPEAVARFDREVRAAARLRSEYVARVYDAGRLADGERYMVLEYLEGQDLSERVQRGGPLQIECAIRFLLQACSAVLEAHVLGIIHRDLKPANLRVVRRADGSEIVKVLDFGVMKRVSLEPSDTLTQETQPGTVIGTPFYSSPEQLRGKGDVDTRTDVWSLGVTLFELLTGQPPFSGKTYAQVIANVLEAPTPSLRSLRPEVGAALEQAVCCCLAKNPSDRFPSVVELAQALAATVDLDSEQSSLLERMVRLQKSPSPSSPNAAEPPRKSSPFPEEPTPGFAVVASSRPSRPVASTPQIAAKTPWARSETRRRYWTLTVSAIATASVVVLVGLPWLPRFDSRRVDTLASAKADSLPAPTPSMHQPRSHDEASTTMPVAVPNEVSIRTQPQTRRPPRVLERVTNSASTRTSAPHPTPSATASAAPTTSRRNPLLVRPR